MSVHPQTSHSCAGNGSFVYIYLAPEEATAAFADLDVLSLQPEARILCPVVIETVLEK